MPAKTTLASCSWRKQIVPEQVNSAIEETIEILGTQKMFPRNAEIYAENEPAQHIYKVVSGTARIYRILANGRRQIGAFRLPSDIFGVEVRDEHAFSAEAITELRAVVVKRSALVALAEKDSDVAHQLWSLIGRELLSVQQRALLLGKTAPERVATFLLEMDDRLCRGSSFELPMSRQDIADYLGLTIETVSRTLTGLERRLAIQMPTSRRIVIRNRATLDQLGHMGY